MPWEYAAGAAGFINSIWERTGQRNGGKRRSQRTQRAHEKKVLRDYEL